MFEKEAKEYAIENYETCLYDDLPYANDSRAREQSFKDGAEFGYNKGRADESINAVEQMNSRIKELHSDLTHKGYAVIQWHKVADGDLPKEFDKPYLCKVYGHFEVGYFMAYKEQPWHFDDYYLDSEDVIAWCEIPRYEGE